MTTAKIKRAAAVLVIAAAFLVISPKAAAGSDKLIALTFDDGPSWHTKRLLDGLSERGAVATFFMTGVNGSSGMTNYGSCLSRMWEDGHQLANHTYTHTKLVGISARQRDDEISLARQCIFDAVGGEYRVMLRPPEGSTDSALCESVNMPIISWSIDPEDWRCHDVDSVCESVINSAHEGAIILLHDMYEASVDVALRVVDTLTDEGYEFVTVSELLRRSGTPVNDGEIYYGVDMSRRLPAYSPPYVTLDIETAEVTLASRDGLKIYYTLDGSYPMLSDNVYTAPFTLTEPAVVTAVGVDEYGTRTPSVSLYVSPSK